MLMYVPRCASSVRCCRVGGDEGGGDSGAPGRGAASDPRPDGAESAHRTGPERTDAGTWPAAW